ncbi:ABC transporter ATP-binding protein [Rhizobium sp. AQ_MP]|uniref:ABC transporter ATP-binding protein n=1 Tax=Rhizobium sp. AQ_MP TaxID=2761536 RepID=UPI00163A88DD|nr:ABC transporter ATP-binding protein [Rhizobium sp. AQ_MP]MBC2775125.1 ABC transporter ATP-binding protein [Rhizobium sp. AQ_MP]
MLPVLSAQNLSKSFTIHNIHMKALSNVSVDIFPGDFTLLIGPSGCGKSTLLAILSGMTMPDEGSVHARNVPLSSLRDSDRDRFRLRFCGFVFQGFNLFPGLTAVEQVQVPLDYMAVPAAEARERAVAALASVGLSKRSHLRPAEMSGGEKQRVAIARAIVKKPAILFADEPTSALDSENGRNIVAILQSIARTSGSAVLCVSHDMRLVKQADRVLQMEDGRLLRDIRPSSSQSSTGS